MPEYLIAFNDEWVGEQSDQALGAKGAAARVVLDEMRAEGALIYTNGALDASTAICSVELRDGEPVFSDGPYAERDEHLGGFLVAELPDDAAARRWAARITEALDWPQEVHRFRGPGQGR